MYRILDLGRVQLKVRWIQTLRQTPRHHIAELLLEVPCVVFVNREARQDERRATCVGSGLIEVKGVHAASEHSSRR